MKNENLGNDPAFPIVERNANLACWNAGLDPSGMSKRFYAACTAMSAIIQSKYYDLNEDSNIEYIVLDAYHFADELLKQENL